MFLCMKTRAEGDYSQGKWRTQGKTQKRPEKCGFFWMGVEIAAKTAGYEGFDSPSWRWCGNGEKRRQDAALQTGRRAYRVAKSA
jgi:hypothetical protein